MIEYVVVSVVLAVLATSPIELIIVFEKFGSLAIAFDNSIKYLNKVVLTLQDLTL